MILLHRLKGEPFALNPDLFERIDSTPDTHIVLIDGPRYTVAETMAEVIALIKEYRAEVASMAHRLDAAQRSAATETADIAAGATAPGTTSRKG